MTGRPVSEVAADLGVSTQAIYNWRRQGRLTPASGRE